MSKNKAPDLISLLTARILSVIATIAAGAILFGAHLIVFVDFTLGSKMVLIGLTYLLVAGIYRHFIARPDAPGRD